MCRYVTYIYTCGHSTQDVWARDGSILSTGQEAGLVRCARRLSKPYSGVMPKKCLEELEGYGEGKKREVLESKELCQYCGIEKANARTWRDGRGGVGRVRG